ncbi:MAG TPA: class I SAM-dependent methyltransferase [Bryobacteraceae bacterium]|nr:class I SAM-dependent methyltransferase [Bryobacteraceae bacterium]
MELQLNKLTLSLSTAGVDSMPATISDRTRRIYDRLAMVYPVSTFFFHSKAHRRALEVAGIHDGMKVLEVATGSGEMFRRLVKVNPNGATVGLDLSPNMAARTQRRVRDEFPEARTQCKAVDARHMPFRDESFDALVCCYLLELLSADDIVLTLMEFRRILRKRGLLTLVLIGQNTEIFNQLYKVCGKIAPAFWGRQVEERVPELIESMDFRIVTDRMVRQTFYPSRVLTARK